jgi:Fe-S cluster assembly scaffold IscU
MISALRSNTGLRSASTLLHRFNPILSSSRSYHQRVHDHYENPQNVGTLPKNDPNVGTAVHGAVACGDYMRFQIEVGEDGIIKQARFKTFGCGSAIASSSLATTWVQGKHIDDALKIKNSDIAKHLSLPPVKLHCSTMAEEAIQLAVKDYKRKKGLLNEEEQKDAPSSSSH